MENFEKSFGALESDIDPRTIQHTDISEASAFPLTVGGTSYVPTDIENQHTVGICTAISTVQLAEKIYGKKYSPDFQYLLQKAFYDGNWDEGSSPLVACKVANKYGFLPAELWTHTTEMDRTLPYEQYVAKLEALNGIEVNRLLALCENKIPGYAQVDITDPQKIAQAILNSPKQAGILCRYWVDKNWWTGLNGVSSWQPKDIDPIRAPADHSDGHQIIASHFDFTTYTDLEHPNTWGILWDIEGKCNINWDNYKMTEAWVWLLTAPIVNQYPTIKMGATGTVVKTLQTLLNQKHNAGLFVDGLFGSKTKQAVENYQSSVGLVADGICGKLTWGSLLKVV